MRIQPANLLKFDDQSKLLPNYFAMQNYYIASFLQIYICLLSL